MIEFAQYVPSCILKNPQTVPTHIDNFSYTRTTFQVNNRVIRNELVSERFQAGSPFRNLVHVGQQILTDALIWVKVEHFVCNGLCFLRSPAI